MKDRITILGAGISGMSTALLLAEKGHKIKMLSEAFFPAITSNKAAAFWFPYHIRNDERGINWCKKSYKQYENFAVLPVNTGISMQKLLKVIRGGEIDQEPTWLEFMPEDSYTLTPEKDLGENIMKQYEVKVPLIETQIFLPWLQNQLLQSGVEIIKEKITSLDNIAKQCDVLINCCGLGAKELCRDEELIPVRGQVALLQPLPGNLPIYLDNELPLYVVPRQDAIIVGGTYEEGIQSEVTESETIEKIVANAYQWFPSVASQSLKGSWAGIRPFRPTVRVAVEQNIIHNYGHGGSGFTLAFGCAQEVVKLTNNLLNSI